VADDAGALLVRSGLIAGEHLAAARAVAAQVGGTLGEHLVAAGLVSDEALTEFYRSRLLVPQVNPNSLARLSAEVIAAIPADMAVEFRVVPVALDREGNLTLAMSDPSSRHAVDEIGFFTGRYVVRAVATQLQIAWCLAHYYGHITDLGTRLLRPATAIEAAATPAPTPTPPPAVPGVSGAAAPAPRSRGVTGRVEAARHRVLAPVTRPPLHEGRPAQALLDPKIAAPPVAPPPVAARAAPITLPAPAAPPVAKGPIPYTHVPASSATATTLVPGGVSSAAVAAEAARLAAERAAAARPTLPPLAPRVVAAPVVAVSVAQPVAPPPVIAAPVSAAPVIAAPVSAAPVIAAPVVAVSVAPPVAPPPVIAPPVPTPTREIIGDDPGEVIEIAVYDPSGPIATGAPVAASSPAAAETQPTGPLVRKRQALPDPPELAARAGELQVRARVAPAALDEAAVVIAIDRLEESAPVMMIEAASELSEPVALTDRLDTDRDPDDSDESAAVARDYATAGDGTRNPDDEDDAGTDPAPPDLIDEGPAFVHDHLGGTESRPILLDRRRTLPDFSAAPDEPDEAGDSDVVLLQTPKRRAPRGEKRTQIGIGAIGAIGPIVPRPGVAADDATESAPEDMVAVVLTAPPEIPAETDRTMRVPFEYAPEHAAPVVPEPVAASGPAPTVAAPVTSDGVTDGVPRPIADEDDDRLTRRLGSGRRASEREQEIDDGWGPPGSTIPPPFLGASLGIDESGPRARIPIAASDEESGRLVVRPATGPLADAAARAADRAAGVVAAAGSSGDDSIPQAAITDASSRTVATSVPPMPARPLARPHAGMSPATPPAPRRPATVPPATTLLATPPRPPAPTAVAPAPSSAVLARDLEDAATTLLSLLRELEKAQARDEVIELLVGHLATSHARVGFFAVKGGELTPFALRPTPAEPPVAMALSRGSTLQDVVGTRLPYRGPVVDEATRKLLTTAFGSAPEEMLALPVAIRDRVVGIVYGDGRHRHTFDEQLAIAARAAGQALERILREHKRAI
jgi:hypothetical protein